MLATIELQSIPAPQLADLVKEAAKNGEITLTDHGNGVAKLVPVAPVAPVLRPIPRFGSARRKFVVPDDFDAHMELVTSRVGESSLDSIVTIVDKVVPAQPDSKVRYKRHFGGANGMIEMSTDFDAPLEEMNDYM